ncbi:GntR family transcriptional regulator [Lapidilactobacillus achengensis]|uniref:GntR family transcriptional regulator n=1 Tax=Lapidilactobacillus achengensis TaxID=2486000 RepID=A0ABW1UQ46_9LACO|nr:GntR family transcriptional regulator [Lapidilactobacillus achengensis]
MNTPKYVKIEQEIRNRIENGEYPQGSKLPNQLALSSEFSVSRMTVKRVLDALAIQGLIYSRRGDGTYVMTNIPQKIEKNAPASEHQGLTVYFGADRVESRIIVFDIQFPSPQIQEKLHLRKNDPVFKIIRLRLVDQQPYVLEHTYMPQKLMPDLDESVLYGSIYAYLKSTGLKLSGSYRKIHAVFADEFDIKYLNCSPKDPVLEVEQVAWLADGTPFEYSLSRNRYDARSYTVVDNNTL